MSIPEFIAYSGEQALSFNSFKAHTKSQRHYEDGGFGEKFFEILVTCYESAEGEVGYKDIISRSKLADEGSCGAFPDNKNNRRNQTINEDIFIDGVEPHCRQLAARPGPQQGDQQNHPDGVHVEASNINHLILTNIAGRP
jgi:hypothetical protein